MSDNTPAITLGSGSPASATWPATTPGPSGTSASPRADLSAPRTTPGVVACPATTAGVRGIRVYLTATTSTGLMDGSPASSSPAALPSASATGPAMCAWRPFSLAKVSKIP